MRRMMMGLGLAMLSLATPAVADTAAPAQA